MAAVLAVDVAGYSRLMGADEVGTLAALKKNRREVVDPPIAARNRRIVKTTGDGMLVEFASAVDAVIFAVEVQGRKAARVASGGGPCILFRVGMDIGATIIMLRSAAAADRGAKLLCALASGEMPWDYCIDLSTLLNTFHRTCLPLRTNILAGDRAEGLDLEFSCRSLAAWRG
ncbi:hypothetical protein [Bradyrhizobium sp. AZCC 2289]|uniref:hypothetical protein n=1 Tax=Bradyrhizobium sp. AZCC 2289 TaxID=3117026 RepID=UPI00305C66DF